METHPRAQLSAYLDGALVQVERAAVAAHLDTCAECRTRLAELRTVASLIGALPALSPSRRLVPRVAAVPVWMAPLRTLTTSASGLAVFMFIASALLSNVNLLARTTGGAAALPAGAPQASGGFAERNAGSAASATASDGSARAPTTADSAAKQSTATAAPTAGAGLTFSTTPPADAAARSDQAPAREAQRPEVPPVSPWLWLALAVVLGAIAFALQRRLRSA